MSVLSDPTIPSDLSTVTPQEVHKRNASEVLLTNWDSFRPDTFVVSARWPVTHRFYAAEGGRHDPLLFAETVRQCFPLLSHAGYGMPYGNHLIWQYLSYEIAPAAMRVGSEPAELDLYITCSDVRRRASRQLSALTLHAVALRDGEHVGTAQARFSSHSPAIYRRLRGAHAGSDPAATPAPPAPVDLEVVGRARATDVVLSPTGQHDAWLLRNDTTHPILFDHPVDHSPGMLLLEAARQAARATDPTEHRYPVKFESTFLQFVEFDAPCRVTARPMGRDSAGRHLAYVVAEQGGETAFSCAVTSLADPTAGA